MKVLVCGASGSIGSAIATRIERDGHQVVRGVRRPTRPEDIAIDYMADLTVDRWLPRLEGIEAVINAVGILVERGGQTFENLHAHAPIALFTACQTQGVRQVIQISALGAESRETPYFASKCAADDFLLAQPIQAYVVRPSMVYSANDVSVRFFRMIARLPVHALPAGGYQALRPIHIDDLTELVAYLLTPANKIENRSCIPAVGNTQVTYREMLGIYREATGLGPARTISIPAWAVRAAAAVCRWIPGSTLTPDTWRMLQRGSTADARPITDALGRAPRGIETFIDRAGL